MLRDYTQLQQNPGWKTSTITIKKIVMMNKLLNKICIGAAVLCSASVISSCTAGLTYEEAPESVYSEVGVSKSS